MQRLPSLPYHTKETLKPFPVEPKQSQSFSHSNSVTILPASTLGAKIETTNRWRGSISIMVRSTSHTTQSSTCNDRVFRSWSRLQDLPTQIMHPKGKAWDTIPKGTKVLRSSLITVSKWTSFPLSRITIQTSHLNSKTSQSISFREWKNRVSSFRPHHNLNTLGRV